MIRAFVGVGADLDFNQDFSWQHRESPPPWAPGYSSSLSSLPPPPLLRKPVFISVQLQKWDESSRFLKLCITLQQLQDFR